MQYIMNPTFLSSPRNPPNLDINVELCKDKHYHCPMSARNHRSKDRARPIIPGMALVAERPHNKHGNSVLLEMV